MNNFVLSLARWLRSRVARSWLLSRLHYRLSGLELTGRAGDEDWYFAYGANMHDSAFLVHRGMTPLEWKPGRARGWRLRFNLEGRPKGKVAPANLHAEASAEVWGVPYRITRAGLVHLDSTEGVPGRRYRHLWLDAYDVEGRPVRAVTYIADGLEADGNPLLRDGARAHGLPDHWLRFLDGVKAAE